MEEAWPASLRKENTTKMTDLLLLGNDNNNNADDDASIGSFPSLMDPVAMVEELLIRVDSTTSNDNHDNDNHNNNNDNHNKTPSTPPPVDPAKGSHDLYATTSAVNNTNTNHHYNHHYNNNNNNASTTNNNNNEVSPDHQRLTNPVHMEIQENAKLPIFYHPVDRQGSSTVGRRHPSWLSSSSTSTNTSTNTSGERFLQDRHRSSYHTHYKEAGALKQQPGTVEPAESFLLHNNIINIDPTPLSEIKRHIQERQQQLQQQMQMHEQQQQQQEPTLSPKPPASQTQSKPSQPASQPQSKPSQSQPASQSQPSPKPAPPPPPMSKHQGQRHHPHGRSTPLVGPPSMQQALATAAALAQHVATPPPTAKPPAKLPPPTARVLQTAPSTRQQFGFGTKHVVPAVPAFSSTKKTKRPPPAIPPTEMPPTDAYERKKQRAKDARVKLNESIDRLHIAIRLALSQSQQRLQLIQRQQNKQGDGDANVQAHFHNLQVALQQTIQTAESAKKWDRPSFVGTAASLIQTLNAQCEALMRSSCLLRTTNGVKRPMVAASSSTVSTDNHHKQAHHNHPKRPRLDASVIPVPKGTVASHAAILQTIGDFLDPRSLTRCHARVCKTWTSLQSFASQWQHLCLTRFGPYTVRQWQETDDKSSPDYCWKALYQNMDTANAVPHAARLLLQQKQQYRSMGETRLANTASAWTYCMERSNGETLRSVRRVLDDGTTTYRSVPVVELRTLIQNTGATLMYISSPLVVDASTRRRAEEWKDVGDDDERFRRRWIRLATSTTTNNTTSTSTTIQLRLYESAVLVSYIHATHCNTISKFWQKSNFAKLLVQVNHTTVPLVIPFPRDAAH